MASGSCHGRVGAEETILLYAFLRCDRNEALRGVFRRLATYHGLPTDSLHPLVGPIKDFIERARATGEIEPEGVIETMIDSVSHGNGATWFVVDSAITVTAFVTARVVESLPTLSPAVEVTLGYARPGTPFAILRKLQSLVEAWAAERKIHRLYFVTKRSSPAWERLGWTRSDLAIYERRLW